MFVSNWVYVTFNYTTLIYFIFEIFVKYISSLLIFYFNRFNKSKMITI